jgi:hypothetical protein
MLLKDATTDLNACIVKRKDDLALLILIKYLVVLVVEAEKVGVG